MVIDINPSVKVEASINVRCFKRRRHDINIFFVEFLGMIRFRLRVLSMMVFFGVLSMMVFFVVLSVMFSMMLSVMVMMMMVSMMRRRTRRTIFIGMVRSRGARWW